MNLIGATESPGDGFIEATLSYPKWCARLVSSVVRSRCSFAAFLLFAIKTSRKKPDRLVPAPTFFPIPLPAWNLFDGMPAKTLNGRASKPQLLDKVVFVILMALNYWHSNGKFVEAEKLQRGLNQQQRAVVKHVRALVKSEDASFSFPICRAGRSFPELTARLSELSEFVTRTGAAHQPYTKTFPGLQEGLVLDNSVMPELEPYRDLDADRLLIHGTGSWDITEYLGDDLVMVYRDPKVLEFNAQPSDCPVIRDAAEEVLKPARKWDRKGLLFAHFDERGKKRPGELVRVFNTFKNPSNDRQIGDRRGRNSVEQRIQGPSRWLPTGPDLQDLYVNPKSEKLAISITDRKDFYHQIKVTRARALTNTVGPGIPTSWLEETSVWPELLRMKSKRRYCRVEHGDMLGKVSEDMWRRDQQFEQCWVSFKSVFQGDHAGVDLATQSHVQLLKDAGLLCEEERVQSQSPLKSSKVAQGLCIDDFFCVSVERGDSKPEESVSAKVLEEAQRVYKKEGLLGSPEKDACAVEEAKVIGAQLNSSDRARQLGFVSLGVPLAKKLSLSYVSLEVCKLGVTTDSLHLCILGAWVSMLMFRRPLMSLFDAAFKLVDARKVDAKNPKVIRLNRRVRDELVLAAVLMPFAVFELSAEYHEVLYATDASSGKGAVVKCEPGSLVLETLWKSCKSKGAYTRFRSGREQLLEKLGMFEDREEVGHEETVRRPLAFRFDFIEVFSGASQVTKFVAELGFSVGPCIDLSESEEYNMAYLHVASWLCHLCSEGHLKGFMLEPPCTTFSIVRRPQLRSLTQPFGYDPSDPATALGTLLAQRSFQVMVTGLRNEVPGLLETTFSSRLRALPSYESLQNDPAADMCRSDSCQFGSQHQKPFRFLSVHMPLRRLARRCSCRKRHVRVQGAYTKKSATYTTELSREIAITFALAMSVKMELDKEEEHLQVDGLENQLVNQVSLADEWEELLVWTFKKPSHINILELSSVLRLAVYLSKVAPRSRVVSLADSSVVRGAVSKGRTASRGLSAVLKKINAVLTAAGIYLTVPFVPTRLNVADDPTRDAEVRKPCGERIDLGKDELFGMACHRGLRRWASNWVRIMFLLIGPAVWTFRDRAVYRRAVLGPSRIVRRWKEKFQDFDSTLGFPGEGPKEEDKRGRSFRRRSISADMHRLLRRSLLWIFLVICSLTTCAHHLTSSRSAPLLVPFFVLLLSPLRAQGSCFSFRVAWILILAMGANAMPLFPRNAGDTQRATSRAARDPPTVARSVLPVTAALREQHARVFDTWLRENEVDFQLLLQRHVEYVEEINMILVRFGRALFAAGRPYNHYLETINLVVARKPLLRRMLQTAWDYAYSWVKQEPSAHHIALPFQVLLACISVSVAWGWDKVAGSLALMWGGLLRAGEFISATRAQLMLPRDAQGTVNFALLSIPEPKTRLTAARHQVAKLDIPDLLCVTDMAFGDLLPQDKLWMGSGQTLRTRFKQILAALSLPTVKSLGMKPPDLGSLRSGGATWLIMVTEQSDLVLRRGRWVNPKTMSIYLQESMAVLYLQQVPKAAKERVLLFASMFAGYLNKAVFFKTAKIPTSQWNALLKLES